MTNKMKVTYTNRNNITRTVIVNGKEYCQLVASVAWTKGEINKVEHLNQKGDNIMDTMTMLELITGFTLLPISFLLEYFFGDKLDE